MTSQYDSIRATLEQMIKERGLELKPPTRVELSPIEGELGSVEYTIQGPNGKIRILELISAELGEFLSGEYIRVRREIGESSSFFPLEQLLDKYTLHYRMSVVYDPPSGWEDLSITITPDGGLDIQGTTPNILLKLEFGFESQVAYREVFAYMLDRLQGLPERPLDHKAIYRRLDDGLQAPEDQKG